jgi:uncharacterized protein with GYD domain
VDHQKREQGDAMPVFCITADYTPAALTEMRNNPTDRRQAAEQFAEAAGGKVLAWYGTMTNGPGVHVIYEVPDLATGPAWPGSRSRAGRLRTFE